MKKFYLTLTGVACCAGIMMSSPLSPFQALQRCTTAATGQRMAPSMRFSAMDLAYTATSADKTPVLYVFARQGEGFVITSADDVAEPMLAYSDHNNFNASDIPENMAWWLGEYSREIEHAIRNPRHNLRAIQRPQREPIAPLCATRWNQSTPYNDMCPEVNGRRTYSGCVATAMAQVMKHHNWPLTGKGSKSYQWNGQTLSMNFAEQTFDWTNMTDTYGANSTEAENHAVAQLMYACGISVNMSYGLNGSGAQSSQVPNALRRYFSYGNSTTFIGRDYVPLLEWEDLIYNSLKSNAPVYYSGQNMSVGHAFVCDGYSNDGYFHFNWGWGGVSDGYFRLTALDPSSQGIGGSNDGYNIYQFALLNALPNTVCDTPMVIFTSSQMVTASYNETNGTLKLDGSFTSNGRGTVTTRFGLQVKNIQSGESTIYSAGDAVKVTSGTSVSSISVNLPRPAAGTYTVTPMYDRTATEEQPTWREMLMPLGEPTIAYMTVAADSVSFAYPEYDLMQGSDLQMMTPVYSNSNFKMKFKITNTLPSEVYEFFMPGILNGNSLVATGDPYSIDLMGNESEEITYIGNFGQVPAGIYELGLIQVIGQNAYLISDRVPIEVKTAQTPSFNVTNLVIADKESVNCSDIKFSFTLNNESGYFAYPISGVIYPGNGGYSITSQQYEPVFIDGAGSMNLNYTLSAPDLEMNKDYVLLVYSAQKQLAQERFHVTTNAVGTIDMDSQWQLNGDVITAPEAITGVKVFNMAGIEQGVKAGIDGNSAYINSTQLAKGIYLVQATTPGGSHTFRMMVR